MRPCACLHVDNCRPISSLSYDSLIPTLIPETRVLGKCEEASALRVQDHDWALAMRCMHKAVALYLKEADMYPADDEVHAG
jgi:hypothetical protein